MLVTNRPIVNLQYYKNRKGWGGWGCNTKKNKQVITPLDDYNAVS